MFGLPSSLLRLILAGASAGLLTGDAPVAVANDASVSAFVTRVYNVRHRDPGSLEDAVELLGSGVRGTRVDDNRKQRTVTIVDYPDQVAEIEKALARLDVPKPKPPELDLEVQVLLASRKTGAGAPPQLERVLRTVGTETALKKFTPLMTLRRRVVADEETTNEGQATLARDADTSRLRYWCKIDDVKPRRGPTGADARISWGRLQVVFEGEGLGKTELRTALLLREGEPTVAGTLPFQDGALVVVATARLIK